MDRDFYKVKRGMVFWYDEEAAFLKYYNASQGSSLKQVNTYAGNVEGKRRPYLVVSCDESNQAASICNIVPITTRDHISIPSQIFYTYSGKCQVIMTEQIKTANISDLGGYLGMVSDNILQKVEDCMIKQFGIRNPYSELESLSQINAVLERIIREKAQQVHVRVNVEDVALQLSQVLEDLFPPLPPAPVKETPEVKSGMVVSEIPAPSQEPDQEEDEPEEEEPEYEPEEEEPESEPEPVKEPARVPQVLRKEPDQKLPKRKKYIKGEKFTLDEARLFLEDYSQYTTTQLMEMYQFPDKKSVQAKRWTSTLRLKDVNPELTAMAVHKVKDKPTPRVEKIPYNEYREKINFSDEDCINFLADYGKLSQQELMEKYGLPDKKSVYNRQYICKKRINHMKETLTVKDKDMEEDNNDNQGTNESD